jgi:hypothetical protein
MAFTFESAKQVVTAHKAELKDLPDGMTIDQYLAEFDKVIATKVEDQRLSAQMAVDTSKTMVTIALAGVAALVAFSQATGYPALLSLGFYLWGLTLFALVVSMIGGAIVVSGIAKRGGGNKPGGWNTDAAKTAMNSQALSGLAAVLLFVGLILVRHVPQIARRFEVDLPGGSQFVTTGELTIHGQCQTLNVEDKRTQVKSQLPPTKAGQEDSISIIPR